ncbi:MAG TPA: helix-hairpin-helix domain-containing protein [Humisphaera sp.]|nr:helix-hairpin-helix domain-containing protein [Humisphaera sp.]
MSTSLQNRDLLWTAPQRRALILLLAILCVAFAVKILRNPQYIPNPQTGPGPRAADLATQLDPNNATWEEFAAIPTLGETRAKAIVAYRDKQQAQHPGAIVFKTPDDLTHVKGIGKATAANIKPYLAFPVEQPK